VSKARGLSGGASNLFHRSVAMTNNPRDAETELQGRHKNIRQPGVF